MALITDVIHERGIIYPQQYVRVDAVRTDKNQMMIDVGVYFSAEIAQSNPPHLMLNLYGEFDLYSEKNLWEQAYVYLKQKWPDAVDA